MDGGVTSVDINTVAWPLLTMIRSVCIATPLTSTRRTSPTSLMLMQLSLSNCVDIDINDDGCCCIYNEDSGGCCGIYGEDDDCLATDLFGNPSLDMKVGTLELPLLPHQFQHHLSPNDPFVTLHLHRHQRRCKVVSLSNCIGVDADALDIVWSKPTIEETQRPDLREVDRGVHNKACHLVGVIQVEELKLVAVDATLYGVESDTNQISSTSSLSCGRPLEHRVITTSHGLGEVADCFLCGQRHP